ncbi:MAG: transcription elongation factor GreA [Candidatus Parcubacteria bacterium]|nr:MAG: transcription elongation factor GreA [Candidatus Parcubacteria bacterium]
MSRVISKEVYEQLKKELENLKKIARKEIAEKIKTAKEFGDLSENAEYQSALEEQKRLERRIFEIENILKTSKVIKSKPIKSDKVNIGTEIEVEIIDNKVKDNKKTMKFKIVGFGESDPLSGKISIESPLGKSLLGKKIGDVVEVSVGKKIIKYKIKSIK